MRYSSSLLFFAAAASSVLAAPAHEHDHAVKRSLPSTWYHPAGHPTARLFQRDAASTIGGTVGSPEWTAAFPVTDPGTPLDGKKMPQAWLDSLNAAVAAGKIPKIDPSVVKENVGPVYKDGKDPMSKEICSSTAKCRIDGDIWDAPDGVVGISFDDGPYEGSDELFDFLKENNQKATHFFIGINVLNNQPQFKRAFEELQDDLAVHTWTHPYMTSLTNEQIVAELGYTMQIIHDLSGGRLPMYWRPPYGDSDMRVTAIAREVFSLTTVIWNQDTEDWQLGAGREIETVLSDLTKWYNGPKTPGLVILEHELNNQTVKAFKDTYPLIAKNGWKALPLSQMADGMKPYRNADSDSGDVKDVPVALAAGSSPDAPPASGSGSAPSGSGSAPSSGSGPKPSGSGSGGSTPTSPAGGNSNTASNSASAPASSGTNAAIPVTRGGVATAAAALFVGFFASFA